MNLSRYDLFDLTKLLEQHERSGYLGDLLGTIVDIRPTIRRKVFMVVRIWDILALTVPSTLLLLSSLWLCLHGWLLASGTQLPEMSSTFWDNTFPGYDFWYDYLAYVGSGVVPGSGYFPERLRAYLIVNTSIGVVATLCSLAFLATVRSSRGIEGWSWEINHDKLKENRILSRIGPFAAVVTEESVVVKKDTTKQILRRVPTPGERMPEVRIGEVVCQLDDQVLYQHEVDELIPNVAGRLYSLKKQQEEERERERAIGVKEWKRKLERKEAEKYVAERQKQMKRNQDFFWKLNINDPLVRTLPEMYAPLTVAGLAYANVVAYGSSPPLQVYKDLEKRWETVGPQVAHQRGIYLIGVSSQRTINRHPLIVGPHLLPGTTSNDLVMFVLDQSGHVCFFANPARFEVEDRTTSSLARSNIDLLKPLLQQLYDQVLNGGPHSGGWV